MKLSQPMKLNHIDELFCDLVRQYYHQPHRTYHGWNHIERLVEKARLHCSVPLTYSQELGLLLHDAIYIPGSPFNEQASMDLLRVLTTKMWWVNETVGDRRAVKPRDLDLSIIDRAMIIVGDTRRHIASIPESETVIDLDLSLLAEPPELMRMDLISLQFEFNGCFDIDPIMHRDETTRKFNERRIGWIDKFLGDHIDRPIYYTKDFQKFEDVARKNLIEQREFLKGQL